MRGSQCERWQKQREHFAAILTVQRQYEELARTHPDGGRPRVVEGSQGWLLGVPSSHVTPGTEVKIWFNGSELELGHRVHIRTEVRVPDGSVGGGAHSNPGAPGWTYLPFTNTGAVGSYTVAILDPQTREQFVKAEFVVAEE